MTTILREVSATERAVHELTRIQREIALLLSYLQTEIQKEKKTAPPPTRELIDRRTRKPWRTRRTGGAQ